MGALGFRQGFGFGQARILASGAKGPVPLPDYVLADAASMGPIRALRAAVLGGTRKKFGIAGDSTSAGYGAGTGTNGQNGARVLAPAAQMVARLNAAGVPARGDGFFGNGGFSPTSPAIVAAYNTDLNFAGSGWSVTSTTALGGCQFQNSTTADAFTFTPKRAADRFDIYHQVASGFGTFTVSDASGTLATINTNEAGNNWKKTSVTRAVASTAPITIARTTGQVRVCGIDPWNSTLAEFCVLNIGVSNSATSYWLATTNVFESGNTLPKLDLDMTYIELGLNDRSTSVDKATYLGRLQSLITQQQADGAIALGVPNPSLSGSFLLPDDWVADIKALAVTDGLPCLDNFGLIGTSDGSLYSAGPHLNATGYAMKGDLLANFALA